MPGVPARSPVAGFARLLRKRAGAPERLRAEVIARTAAFAFAVTSALAGQQTLAGLMLFLAGLPHGAAIETSDDLRAIGFAQATAYLVAAAAFVALFVGSPAVGLGLFLALSAWHLAIDDEAAGPIARLAVAGLVIGGSALFRPQSTEHVFAMLTGGGVPPEMVSGAAVCGMVGVASAGVLAIRRRPEAWIALAMIAGFVVLDPVLATGLAFFAGHALPVQCNQIRRYGFGKVMRAEALPSVLAMLGAVALAVLVWRGIVPLPAAAALAFGLALPHMLAGKLEPVACNGDAFGSAGLPDQNACPKLLKRSSTSVRSGPESVLRACIISRRPSS